MKCENSCVMKKKDGNIIKKGGLKIGTCPVCGTIYSINKAGILVNTEEI